MPSGNGLVDDAFDIDPFVLADFPFACYYPSGAAAPTIFFPEFGGGGPVWWHPDIYAQQVGDPARVRFHNIRYPEPRTRVDPDDPRRGGPAPKRRRRRGKVVPGGIAEPAARATRPVTGPGPVPARAYEQPAKAPFDAPLIRRWLRRRDRHRAYDYEADYFPGPRPVTHLRVLPHGRARARVLEVPTKRARPIQRARMLRPLTAVEILLMLDEL